MISLVTGTGPDGEEDEGVQKALPFTPITFQLHFSSMSIGGENMCCTGGHYSLASVYNSMTNQTENITTFMQKDLATVDMGYITNGGFTLRRGGAVSSDNKFMINVEVRAVIKSIGRFSQQVKQDIFSPLLPQGNIPIGLK